jgi:MoaA/NifB/PqqE/SkfB family radical SAM enzyme
MSASSRLRSLKDNRWIYIWGARAIGCGVLRWAERTGLPIRGFIDSDPTFKDRKVLGYKVAFPEMLKKRAPEEKPFIIIASTTSDDTISQLCKQMGFEQDIDFCTSRDLCNFEYVIDIVGYCHLACPSCPRGNYGSQPPRGLMSVEYFTSVMQKIVKETPQVTVVGLFNWGEPLLHPRLTEIIGVLNEMKIFSSVSTNFNVRKDLSKLVAAKLDMLKVSVSGFYQETYGSNHRGGDVELVKSNLYQLREIMDRYQSEMEVEIIYHKYNDNTGEDLRRFKLLAQELDFHFAEVFAYFMPVEKVVAYLQERATEHDLNLVDRLTVDIHQALMESSKEPNRQCPLRDKQMVVNWDGSVSLCCASFDPVQTRIVDSFLDVSLGEIQSRRQQNGLCQVCLDQGIDQYYFETSQRAR